jgi:VWFA-related protein
MLGRFVPAILLAVLALMSAPGLAQVAKPLYSAKTDLVVVHATVKDPRGGYVTGLPKEAFSVLEDGRLHTISLFASDDAPVTVGLVVDNSSSMQPTRDDVIRAAEAFATSSNPQNEIFALAFNERARSALPSEEPFTSDIATLRGGLARALSPRGRTALLDAVAEGLDYLKRGRYERNVLVVLSDGGDNASRGTVDDVLARAQASNALIYTVALTGPVRRSSNPRLLKQIAEASGGEAFVPRDAREIGDVLRQIARDIRFTYTLGYISTNSAGDGRFRAIRLVVKPPDGRHVVVRTRPGYVAGS